MSNFTRLTRHPKTGELKNARWIQRDLHTSEYIIRFEGETDEFTRKDVHGGDRKENEALQIQLYKQKVARLDAINVYATASLAGIMVHYSRKDDTQAIAELAFEIAEAMQVEYEKRKEAIK